jgi:regulator of protease activity HflC (stomatin/prohibitin superfamily)
MMKPIGFTLLALCALASSGCYGETIEPGHRGLLFSPKNGGLGHEVLGPGYHKTSAGGRIDDFDVTYSTKTEQMHALSSEGLAVDLRVAVRYRPIVAELYYLDTEIGSNYYDEVIGPEFRSAARGVLARHSYVDLNKVNEKVEDEIEADLRRRTKGKHLEITAVTLEQVEYAPEIAQAIRSRVAGEQEATRQKAQLENDALKRKLEIERASEQDKLRTEAELRQKKNERALAAEQAEIDKTKAQTDAQVAIVTAKAQAEAARYTARADAEKHRAEASTITPLEVQMHAYDALAQLGGSGTTLYLGDFSRVPQFLFPGGMGMPMPYGGGARPAGAPTTKPASLKTWANADPPVYR